jgi:hypothetical protein
MEDWFRIVILFYYLDERCACAGGLRKRHAKRDFDPRMQREDERNLWIDLRTVPRRARA